MKCNHHQEVVLDLLTLKTMGKFIAIYGVNNIGKTTQVNLLAERLKNEGYKVTTLKYPIYENHPTGPRISDILRKGTEPDIKPEHFQMLYCLNRFDTETNLKQLIQEFDIVIAEDYTYTSVAWGAANGVSKDWLLEINKYLLKPDHSILLDGERVFNSIEEGHKFEDDDALPKKVQQVFREIQQKFGFPVVIRQEKMEDTHNLMYNALMEHIKPS